MIHFETRIMRMGELREFSWVYSRHSQIRGIRVESFPTLRKPWHSGKRG
jgi:hypothetical protein